MSGGEKRSDEMMSEGRTRSDSKNRIGDNERNGGVRNKPARLRCQMRNEK